MIKIKTAEAIGPALDWLVAKCEEGEELAVNWHPHKWLRGGEWLMRNQPYSPSTDWSQGGPIIERERIAIAYEPSQIYDDSCRWKALWPMGDRGHDYGPTPLIAAMRYYCCSILGDEVEIPKELQLCQQQNN